MTHGRRIWKTPKPYNMSQVPNPDKIRLEGPHLIRFKDHWYCAFREAQIHNDHPSGKARIIRSTDGERWESVALMQWDGGDVSGLRFSITAEGMLMGASQIIFVSDTPRAEGDFHQLDGLGLFGAIRQTDAEAEVSCQAVTWLTGDGLDWGSAYACASGVNTRRYDVAWHNGMGYAIAQIGKDIKGTLYRTRDGKQWRVLKEGLIPDLQSDEADLAFGPDGTAWCIHRGSSRTIANLGIGKAPYYQEWQWKRLRVDWRGDGNARPIEEVLRVALGGPDMIRLRDGRLLVAARTLGPARAGGGVDADRVDPEDPDGREDGRVALFWLDPDKSLLTLFTEVDGTSYPGIFEHEGMIWVSYCGADRSGIFLAKVKIPN